MQKTRTYTIFQLFFLLQFSIIAHDNVESNTTYKRPSNQQNEASLYQQQNIQDICCQCAALLGNSTSTGIGIEALGTSNGSPVGPFLFSGAFRIWSANGGTTNQPSFAPAAQVWAPFGSTVSYITVIPGGVGQPDAFVCSKNIRTLRFYTVIQTSVASTSRWRTQLLLNGVVTGAGQSWGAPPNNVGNQRVFGVLEFGGIAAGTVVSVRIENNTLPNSLQNNNSYFVIEYNL